MRTLFLFICALLVTPFAGADRVEPIRGMTQDSSYCERVPDALHCRAECDGDLPRWVTWCEGPHFEPAGREPTASDIRGADLIVRGAWSFRKDYKDVWKSFEDEVAAGDRFRGDCEDIVLTVQALLDDEGIHPDFIGRAIVYPPNDDVLDHMVGIANINGVIWIFGDTYGEARPLAETGYRVKWFQWARDGLAWKTGSL